MKVVHLVATDVGGAYRAAERISEALNKIGVDSEIVLMEKKNDNNSGTNMLNWRIILILFKILRRINEKIILKSGLGYEIYKARLGFNILKFPAVKNADIINLHWVNNGMLSYKGLARICKSGKKVVWTLHDMYAFTAGCYYDNYCGNYIEKCENCKYAESNPKVQRLIDQMYKKKSLAYQNITFIGCSNWISICAKQSSLCKRFPIYTIPNPINTDIFYPMERKAAADVLGINLSDSKKVIVFGAMSSTSDERKGFQHLLKAINQLNEKKYRIIIFGNSSDKIIETQLDCLYLGKIERDDWLRAVYSVADVFVAPSKQENLSNAVMESIACGTPVAAFNVGGMSDMIEHMTTGYLASPFKEELLCEGIEWCAANKMEMIGTCVDKVSTEYLPTTVGLKYKAVYLHQL